MVENNCGDYSGTVLPYYGCFCGTDITKKLVFRENKITTITDSVLPSLQIDVTKSRIQLGWIYNATNITIIKITESVESHKTLKANNDTLETHLHINLKYIVILVESLFPCWNMSHSIIFIPSENNFIYYQHKIETAIYHY